MSRDWDYRDSKAAKEKRPIDFRTLGYAFTHHELMESGAWAEKMLKQGRPMFDALLYGAHRREMLKVVAKYPKEAPADWDKMYDELKPFCLTSILAPHGMAKPRTRALSSQGGFDRDRIKADMQHEFTVEYTAFQYLHAGERDFAVSRSLGEALALTDPGDVLTEEIKLPFSTVRLMVPRGLFQTYDVNPGVWDQVYAVYVYKIDRDERGEHLAIFVTSVRATDDGEATEIRAFLPVVPGQKLQAALDTYATSALPFQKWEGDKTIAKAATGEEGIAAIARVFGWVCNVLLYITQPGAEIEGAPVSPAIQKLREQAAKHPKGSHKGERARAALKQVERTESQPKVYKVGSSISIPGYADVSADERERALSGGRQYRSAWLQRGHWRSQPHGIGFNGATETGHHAVWIKPMVKRRDLGMVVKRTYAVLSADDRPKEE